MVISFLRELSDPNPAGEFMYDNRAFKKSGGSAPEAPDPAVTAAAQAKYSKDTALWNSALNNVNQFTPYGSLTWSLGGHNDVSSTASNNSNSNNIIDPNSHDGMWRNSNGDTFDDRTAARTALKYYNGWSGEYDEMKRNGTLGTYLQDQGYTPMGGQQSQNGSYSNNSQGSSFSASGLPQWESTVNLSPEMQEIFDSQMRQQKQLGGLSENALSQVENAYSTPYNYDSLQSLFGEDDLNAARDKTEEAIYSRLNPQFDRDEEALRTRLINQGIGQNSEAYNNEFNRFNEAKTDARMQAVLAGGTESDRALRQSMAIRQQGIGELDKTRQQPLNEYLAMSGQQQLTNPQFNSYNYSGAQTPDYAGLVNNQYQAQLGQYNADQASSQNAFGSVLGLAGTLGGSYLGGGGSLFGGLGG